MKTIEEKAKAYDEIIERAKTMLSAGEVMYGKENNASQLITDLIPELAESEDERMRKEIEQSAKEYYKENYAGDNPQGRNVVIQSYIDGALAYLEKQKEQKHYCPSNDDLEDAAMEFRGKCLPPIEPISDELIDIIKDEFEGFRRLLKKKGIDYEPQRGYWEGFARLFDSSAREYVKEQKEQKPVENNVIIPQFHIGDYIKPKAYNEEHLIKDINKNGYVLDIDMIIPFKDEDVWQLAEQKPAEWSEEDKNIFNLALDLIKHSDDCDGILDKELAVKWFAELPSRFIPQPKQEWNTHDKAAVNCIVRCLDGQFVSEAARKQCLEWFNKHRRDFLNSPSWKPSEEQMEALENSTALTEEQGMALYSLIQDLKKLYYDRREN